MKKRKKKSRKADVPGRNEKANLATEQEESGKNRYGGIPERDLKKNLGCG